MAVIIACHFKFWNLLFKISPLDIMYHYFLNCCSAKRTSHTNVFFSHIATNLILEYQMFNKIDESMLRKTLSRNPNAETDNLAQQGMTIDTKDVPVQSTDIRLNSHVKCKCGALKRKIVTSTIATKVDVILSSSDKIADTPSDNIPSSSSDSKEKNTNDNNNKRKTIDDTDKGDRIIIVLNK